MKGELSTVTSKGQLVIPSKLRKKFGIRKGTQVVFVEEERRLILQPITPEYIHSLRGILKVNPGEQSPLDLLLEDRKREREL